MTRYIRDSLRFLVAIRADHLCEYCLIHEEDTYFGCEVDHIISLKHGGITEETNLAYCCSFCNRHKGSDLGSIIHETGQLIRFFNPRTDLWADHFRLSQTVIEPLTDIASVTVQIFGFNETERILEREALIATGRYPTEQARARMQV